MRRTTGLVLSRALLWSAGTIATAHAPPEASQVVERFAAAVSAGDLSAAYALLSQGAVWSERDLFWRVAPTQPHAGERLRELIAADARIELEVDAVLGDGTMVIVSELLWSDDVPDDLAPLRSTTLYLVEQGLVQGITRVLSAEQRDALFAEAMVGPWRCGAFTRFDADGTYGRYLSLEYLRSARSYDSGTYAVEGGVITTVSGDGSEVCEAGQLIRFSWDVIDADTFAVATGETDCPHFARIAHMPFTFRRLHEE